MNRLKEIQTKYLSQVSYFIQLNAELGYSRLKLTLKFYITFYIKTSVNFILKILHYILHKNLQ
jgi:hypothetical protein